MAVEREPLFCIVVGSGMIGSACAASVAALSRGPVALVGPSSQKSSQPPYSSHDDYSRVVSVLKSNIGGAPGDHDLALESECVLSSPAVQLQCNGSFQRTLR